ncbi:polyprenyl synthetase family protein [Helcobacillus sp. ACRRO]|uniref:polyprenyl synthetase family protein n=1 Tax=Helcobacillus TaxID=1161125 RepID=UPI001EF52DD4|nr:MULTISPECIES: polyprenyl synthetase family protein [Helcobacillus]MCG7427457.1 polyprenyl synthetase family protein [Helcobacillus sp. ACRRO]MDK7742775.1 polyprenyl synthetase family protein [Helcobacillus massiliensis]
MSSFALPSDLDDAFADSLLTDLAEVEKRLNDAVATHDAMAQWTAKHLMVAGGKRIRPLLVLLAAHLGEGTNDKVLDAAVLVELTHLASLYHDDVMDGATTRRGTRAAHQVWGNNVAILTGDFLFARASALSAKLGPEAVLLHANTFERLCLGQLNETVGPAENADAFQHYISVLENKTGSLIAAAGILGAQLGNAAADTVGALGRYGEAVGVAFQLADDVIDLRSNPETSGKTPGTDLREGVPTMPTLLLRQRHADGDDAPGTTAVLHAIESDLESDDALQHAVKLLAADPATDRTQELADEYGDEAIDIISDLPESQARSALLEFTTQLVRRSA